MKQTIEIEVPNGKKAIWKDSKIIFEDIKSQLPKTWSEFCKLNPTINTEYFFDNGCWNYSIIVVISFLNFSSSVCFSDAFLH